MCNVTMGLHLICFSYSLFYKYGLLNIPVANKIEFKICVKFTYLYM